MTILNESGAADVLPPLCGAHGLTAMLPDAIVAVLGTRTEVHLSRTLPAAVLPEEPGDSPRFLTLELDPASPPEEGRVAARIIEAAAGLRGTDLVLLVAGRSAKLLGVDAGFEARLISRRLGVPARVVSPDPEGNGCLSTDLEDRALAALIELCREETPEAVETAPEKRGGFLGSLRNRERARPAPRSPVVLVGAVAGEELSGEMDRAGVEVAGTVPAGSGRVEDLPGIGAGTVVAITDPHLTSTARAVQERGAQLVRTLMPIGVGGTARFVQDVASATGEERSEIGRARAVWEELEHLRNRIRGKRIFFAGDTGLEIPLARFLADAGAVVLEVGAPRLDRRLLNEEIRALGPDVDIVQEPDWHGQMERVLSSRPDIVVASPGLFVPLVGHGQLCRPAQDFLGTSIYGYAGARRILELFARTFERADALDSVGL